MPLTPFQSAAKPRIERRGFRECTVRAAFLTALLTLALLAPLALLAETGAAEQQRQAFYDAWDAARRGDRETFKKALPGLRDYLLFPYLQYEDYRHDRARVAHEEMSAFLEAHRGWAFIPGLETAWLRTLGRKGRWDQVLVYGGVSDDTEVRCHFAHARILRGQTDGLLPVAQALWTVGKSQPDACDPVFAWLKESGGIGSGLAWERFTLAIKARERGLARYVTRFMDDGDRTWANRWIEQDRGGYRRLDQAASWPGGDQERQIIDFGLRRLARNDPDRAWELFESLDGRAGWSDNERGGLLADLALWSAVDRSPGTLQRMKAVPEAFRDDRLLEWRARYQLTEADWDGVSATVAAMSGELRDDSRWQYWAARAQVEAGRKEAGEHGLERLAARANFYGFVAADHLDLPYSICPEEPQVDDDALETFYAREGVRRALELRGAGLSNWARIEWAGAVSGLDDYGLRAAAAVGVRESWPDMAIRALGNSGDLRWYEWRFPLGYAKSVRAHSGGNGLDVSWVMGLMRSESALAEDAVSHAGARGLMQITPQTAKQLARRHKFQYGGRAELFDAETNIRFGTAYLGDLMERFSGNPVLATGAYNAGPHVVDRWLADGYTGDPVVWIDTLPYFETRDYIPRVLAFSTIYEWRMGQPVKRISTRMPAIAPKGSATGPGTAGTARIACAADS